MPTDLRQPYPSTRGPPPRWDARFGRWPAVVTVSGESLSGMRQVRRRPYRAVIRMEGRSLAKYLWHGSYSVEGIKGVRKEGGTGRVEAIEALARSVGGSLESFYFGFGGDDFY